MYKANDVVMYGTAGLCTINSIELLNFTGKEQYYYVLKHLNSEKIPTCKWVIND